MKETKQEELSEETRLWIELLNKFRQWQKHWDKFDGHKLIATPPTQAQFIRELKSEYYLDRMKHGR